MPLAPPPIALHYAIVDMTARVTCWALLVVGSCLLVRRSAAAVKPLVAWAVLRVVWPPVSLAMAMRLGEPSPEMVAAVLPAAISFNASAFVFSSIGVGAWLLLPSAFTCWWLWRRRGDLRRSRGTPEAIA